MKVAAGMLVVLNTGDNLIFVSKNVNPFFTSDKKGCGKGSPLTKVMRSKRREPLFNKLRFGNKKANKNFLVSSTILSPFSVSLSC